MKKMPTERAPQVSVIVPTLNEESDIGLLLESLGNQSSASFETLIVDGGSEDKTPTIADQYSAKIVVLPGHGEFTSRNIGAKMSRGSLLLFTCADIMFPQGTFRRIMEKFDKNPGLIAMTGRSYPFDAPLIGKIEYAVYELVRYFFASLPRPLKRFSTSTNFLVVKKDYFDRTGGFIVDDINADGLMGRELLRMGEVAFCMDTFIYLSARRMKAMGFVSFNKHYLYALENLFFSASKNGLIQAIKLRSKMRHRKMHENVQ